VLCTQTHNLRWIFVLLVYFFIICAGCFGAILTDNMNSKMFSFLCETGHVSFFMYFCVFR